MQVCVGCGCYSALPAQSIGWEQPSSSAIQVCVWGLLCWLVWLLLISCQHRALDGERSSSSAIQVWVRPLVLRDVAVTQLCQHRALDGKRSNQHFHWEKKYILSQFRLWALMHNWNSKCMPVISLSIWRTLDYVIKWNLGLWCILLLKHPSFNFNRIWWQGIFFSCEMSASLTSRKM